MPKDPLLQLTLYRGKERTSFEADIQLTYIFTDAYE